MNTCPSIALGNCRAVEIVPQPFQGGSVRPPGSKSLTNRALVCAALADGPSSLTGVLESEDTHVMIAAWRTLGIQIDSRTFRPSTSRLPSGMSSGEKPPNGTSPRKKSSSGSSPSEASHSEIYPSGKSSSNRSTGLELTVHGQAGCVPAASANLFMSNSGTSIRFMTAALATCQGDFVLDGVERMRQRPIGDLLRALRQLGADVSSLNSQRPECPPVQVRARGLSGGNATVAGNISSQYLSAIMLASPMARQDVIVHVDGELVSVPYVSMTARVMQAFGAQISGPATGPIKVSAKHKYRAAVYDIEPDASAASYFWAAAAIHGADVSVAGLNRESLQGDIRFCEVLRQMGCEVEYNDCAIRVCGAELRGITANMSDISDTVQSLAAVALFAHGPTTVLGVAHNRHKETDRISDLAVELRKLGAEVDEFADGLRISPPARVRSAEIATYNDHRMAMSLALVGTRVPGIIINNPQCTAKTYPEFWQDLKSLMGCGIQCLD